MFILLHHDGYVYIIFWYNLRMEPIAIIAQVANVINAAAIIRLDIIRKKAKK